MTNTSHVISSLRLCWRGILAGALVALSIHLLLTMLGAGITALVVNSSTSDSPVQSFTTGMAITWSLSALISLWIGGWVAGRVGAAGDADSGRLQGFVVWSLATVVGFLLVAAGVGKALGVAGQTLAGAGKAAVEAAPALIDRSAAMIEDYSAEVTRDGKPMTPAATRELTADLKNLLLNGEAGRTAQNRDALVATITRHTGMTPEEAGKTVDEWTASYDRAVKEAQDFAAVAAAKAKEIADRTSRATGAAAIWTFFAFWIGAVLAAWGGKCGAVGCAGDDSAARQVRRDREPQPVAAVPAPHRV
jgi:hypothetical protein